MRPTPSLIPRLISYVPHAPHAPAASASMSAHAPVFPLARPYQYASPLNEDQHPLGLAHQGTSRAASVHAAVVMQDVEWAVEGGMKWGRHGEAKSGKSGYLKGTQHCTSVYRPSPPIRAAPAPTSPPSAQSSGSGPPANSNTGSGSGSGFGHPWSDQTPYMASTKATRAEGAGADAHSSPTDHRVYSAPDGRPSTVPAPTLAWCDFLSMV